jgi:DNA mismatch repair protein MutL
VANPSHSRGNNRWQYLLLNGRPIRDRALQHALSEAYRGLLLTGRYPICFLRLEMPAAMVDVNVHPRKEEVRFTDHRLVQGEVKRALQAALLSQQIVPRLEPERLRPPREGLRYREYRRTAQGEGLELDLQREFAEWAARERPPAPPEPGWRILGQLHNTYILVQTDEGLELIDQHVAHERVLYEKFMAQLDHGEVPRQRLLIPMTIELPPERAELLAEHLDFLAKKLGIGLEAFGGGSFILRDWPEALAERLGTEGAREAIEKVLDLLESGEEPEFAELAKDLAAELACAAALVKNTPLSPEEMQNIVQQLRGAENPYRCPHGRPIVVKYTLEDLEKRFARR